MQKEWYNDEETKRMRCRGLGILEATIGSDLLTHTPDLASGELGKAGVRGVIHEVGCNDH